MTARAPIAASVRIRPARGNLMNIRRGSDAVGPHGG